MFWTRPRPRRDGGQLEVVGCMVVGVVAVSAIVAVTTLQEPSPRGDAGRSLARGLDDAIGVLREVKASDPAYSSQLEELVTHALEGDEAPLRAAVAPFLPVGSDFTIGLENGEGGFVPALTNASLPRGEKVARSTLITPHWSRVIARADVEQLSGHATADLSGNTVDPTDYLRIRAVYVHGSYADIETSLTLTLANGRAIVLNPDAYNTGTLDSGRQAPAYFSAPARPMDGYAVPYDMGSYVAYTASWGTRALADPVAFGAVPAAMGVQPISNLYKIHPKYTLAEQAGEAIASIISRGAGLLPDSTPPDFPYQLGTEVHLTYTGTSSIPGLTPDVRTIRVFDPVGRIVFAESHTRPSDPNSILHGAATYSIPRDSLWGSYAAELEISLHDSLDLTKVYVVHLLTHFDVDPATGFGKGAQHVPPTYRAAMIAWNQDEP